MILSSLRNTISRLTILERAKQVDIFYWLDVNGIGVPKMNQYVYLSIDKSKIVEKEIYTRRDIMNILDCKPEKATKVLKLMKQMGLGFQLGREYYTTKPKLLQFFEEQMGNTIYLED